MSVAEQQQVLQAFNDTGLPAVLAGPQGSLVHHQFMRQAAAHPEAPCLVYEGEVLSYGQVRTLVVVLQLLSCAVVRAVWSGAHTGG